MKYHIYALLRKGAHRPFYIGATYDPRRRGTQHRSMFGRDFTLVVIETVDNVEEASKLEAELIVWYQSRGAAKENRTCIPSYCGPDADATEPETCEEKGERALAQLNDLVSTPEFRALAEKLYGKT